MLVFGVQAPAFLLAGLGLRVWWLSGLRRFKVFGLILNCRVFPAILDYQHRGVTGMLAPFHSAKRYYNDGPSAQKKQKSGTQTN